MCSLHNIAYYTTSPGVQELAVFILDLGVFYVPGCSRMGHVLSCLYMVHAMWCAQTYPTWGVQSHIHVSHLKYVHMEGKYVKKEQVLHSHRHLILTHTRQFCNCRHQVFSGDLFNISQMVGQGWRASREEGWRVIREEGWRARLKRMNWVEEWYKTAWAPSWGSPPIYTGVF